MNIKILDEIKQINLLCLFPCSWDSLIITIRNNVMALMFDDIVLSMLSK